MCWSCHGFAGRGDGPAVQAGAVPPPPDFKTVVLAGTSVRQLQAAFRSQAGSLDPTNPHMANVLSVVDVDAFSEALAYLPALTYPPEIAGSAIAGHRNYLLRCQEAARSHRAGQRARGGGPGSTTGGLHPRHPSGRPELPGRVRQDSIRRGGRPRVVHACLGGHAERRRRMGPGGLHQHLPTGCPVGPSDPRTVGAPKPGVVGRPGPGRSVPFNSGGFPERRLNWFIFVGIDFRNATGGGEGDARRLPRFLAGSRTPSLGRAKAHR